MGAPNTLKSYSNNEILPIIGSESHTFNTNFGDFTIKLQKNRYFMFKNNLSCVNCGITGSIWRLQAGYKRDKNKKIIGYEKPHLNLFTENNVLMTQDHIIPKSKGGSDELDNLQTMCCYCNGAKGNNI